MNQRLALLSAILAAPDDDLPRLVFADWLEEYGTTDADVARVEFIRLGCKLKAKSRMSPAEGKWLDANWQRLLGNTLAARPKGAKPPRVERDGRFLRMRFRWTDSGRPRAAEMSFEFVRGFVRRVEYLQGHAYKRFWQATATDEQIAYHRPELPPNLKFNAAARNPHATLFPDIWGDEVFERAGGFAEEVSGRRRWKEYRGVLTDPSVFLPLAVEDDPHFLAPHHRLRAAVATAMTAIAREFVGLIPHPAGGG
jgi:uncharacterized protein (TIGR02996 family)